MPPIDAEAAPSFCVDRPAGENRTNDPPKRAPRIASMRTQQGLQQPHAGGHSQDCPCRSQATGSSSVASSRHPHYIAIRLPRQ